MEIYSSKLKCLWSALRPLDERAVALDLQDGNCCDMRGAIELAMAVNPKVQRIETFAGGVPDAEYRLGRSGWEAFLPKH